MYCSKCGKELREGARFCSYCGTETNDYKIQSEQSLGSISDSVQMQVECAMDKKQSGVRWLAVIVGGVLVCILLAVGVFFVFSGTGQRRYEALVSEGNRYLNKLQYKEAVIAFTKAIAIEEKVPELYVSRAEAYMGLAGEAGSDQKAQDYYTLAEDDYKNALNEDDQLTEVYHALVDVYLTQDDAENAKAILKQGYQATGDERLSARYSELDDEMNEGNYSSGEGISEDDMYYDSGEISREENETIDLKFQRPSWSDYTSEISIYSINFGEHSLDCIANGKHDSFGTLSFDGNIIDENVHVDFLSNGIVVYYAKKDGIYRASLKNGTNEKIISEFGHIYDIYMDQYLYYRADLKPILYKGNGALGRVYIGVAVIKVAEVGSSNVKIVSEKADNDLVIMIHNTLYFPEYNGAAEFEDIKSRLVKYNPVTGETEILTDFYYGLATGIADDYVVFTTFDGEKTMVPYMD